MSDDTSTVWTPTRVLMTHAKGFRDAYWSTASFYQKDKLKAYTDESYDWGLWLHIVAELFGEQINLSEYLKICNARWSYSDIPRPSELLSQKFRDKYREWHRKQVREGDDSLFLRTFFSAIREIDGQVSERESDWANRSEEPLPEMRNERNYQCFITRYATNDDLGDLSLEELTFAWHHGFATRICDDYMLMMSALRYYPLREIFSASQASQKSFEEFDPIAKKEYMRLTDYSAVDFDDVAEQMSRRCPELHPQF